MVNRKYSKAKFIIIKDDLFMWYGYHKMYYWFGKTSVEKAPARNLANFTTVSLSVRLELLIFFQRSEQPFLSKQTYQKRPFQTVQTYVNDQLFSACAVPNFEVYINAVLFKVENNISRSNAIFTDPYEPTFVSHYASRAMAEFAPMSII